MRVTQVFTLVLPFNLLWIVVNYLYIYALSYIAATDASAILSSNVAFVYILSFVLLGELFYFTRVRSDIEKLLQSLKKFNALFSFLRSFTLICVRLEMLFCFVFFM